MYKVSIDAHKKLTRGEQPITYAIITTPLGNRVYAEKELKGVFSVDPYLADGTYTADGTELAGRGFAGTLDKQARILSFGSFDRTLQPRNYDILTAYNRNQKQHMSMVLANADKYISKLLPKEPFIGRPVADYVGFETLPQADHLQVFSGEITEIIINQDGMVNIEADER